MNNDKDLNDENLPEESVENKQKVCNLEKQLKSHKRYNTIVSVLITPFIILFIFAIMPDLSYKLALMTSGLVETRLISDNSWMGGGRLIFSDTGNGAIAYVRINAFGLWTVEQHNLGTINPGTGGLIWQGTTHANIVNPLDHLGEDRIIRAGSFSFKHDIVYHNTNANTRIHIDPYQLPPGVTVNIGQLDNEYWLHFITFTHRVGFDISEIQDFIDSLFLYELYETHPS